MFFKFFNRASKNLFHQAIDDLNTCQVTLVHGTVCGLSGKRFLVERSVFIAVEKAADLVFKLVDADYCLLAQAPRHVLVRQPFAAIDRVHEMALNGIATAECNIVAALHHTCATAFADQPLYGNRDPCTFGGRLLCMKCRKKSGPSRTKDQDICIVTFYFAA